MKFIQFFRKESYLFDDKNFYTNFNNGLSQVWNSMKHDNIWCDDYNRYHIWCDSGSVGAEHTRLPEPIPGETYMASCWYKYQVLDLFNWAKQNPDIEVIVAGPIVLHYDLRILGEIPNFKTCRVDAEDHFNFDTEWGLEIPKNVKGDIGYAVSLTKGKGCYWSKCRFCKITGELNYRDIDEIPIIDHDGHKYIWLHTFALSPKMIDKYYTQFPDRNDVTYQTYIRADRANVEAYKKVLPKLKVDPKYFGFDVGIEFPTNRMLQYMNKGTTIQDYLDFIKITSENETRLHFNLIINWKYTNWDDVKNVEKWLNDVTKITKPNTITANLYPLVIVSDRGLWDEYDESEIKFYNDNHKSHLDWNNINIWDAKMGDPILSEESKEISRELQKLYHSFPFLKLHDWIGQSLY